MDAELNPKAGGVPKTRQGDGHSILVVDDEAIVGRALERLLRRAGYEVAQAESGAAATALLDKHSFDVVLSDIHMPGMTGIDLLRAVKERDLDVPVILLTGGPELHTAMRAIEMGAFRYLTKPIAGAVLLQAMEEAARCKRFSVARRQALALQGEASVPFDRIGLDTCLTRALEGAYAAFQPLVDSKEKRTVAFEALLRSNEPTLPHPGAVLDAAERLDRVADVLPCVLASVGRSLKDAPADALLFVNLHPVDLSGDLLLEDACPIRHIASRVVLEVTERASLTNVASLAERVGLLREAGYRIAIDDLGAGYASLNAFVDLSPEFVKIDMGLIRGIDKSAARRSVVRTLTQLSHEMGAVVVAEGVETVEERDVLVELGCDLLQGFLFARPGVPWPDAGWDGQG